MTTASKEEEFCHDFLPPDRSLDDVKLYYCGNQMDLYLRLDRSEDVEMGVFICPVTNFEKKLKAFKER